MRIIEVVSYDEAWKSHFTREADQLSRIFLDELLEIHHIGSTAIPGMKAKPIIDIIPVVKDISRIDRFYPSLIDLGYDPKGENGIPGRRFFCKGGDNRTHHVHVFQMGNPQIERHLAFRDYLRTHPEASRAYCNLKEKLAASYRANPSAYNDGKSELIQQIEQEAILWYRAIH